MGLVDLLFPKKCLGCGREGVYLCSVCVDQQSPTKPICPMCEKASVDGMTHVRCKKKLGLDGLVSVWSYSGVVRKAILKLKYSYARDLSSDLGKSIILKLKKDDVLIAAPELAVLIPVPLFWFRKNDRGFNQSLEVSKKVATGMNLKFVPDLLFRKSGGKHQTQLKGKERRKNVRGVFMFNKKYDIADTNTIIFDDVYTTGSTIKEACKVLKRNGAGKVWGLTIAR